MGRCVGRCVGLCVGRCVGRCEEETEYQAYQDAQQAKAMTRQEAEETLSTLDDFGTLRGIISQFVESLPEDKALHLCKTLAGICRTKDGPFSYLRKALQDGWAMDVIRSELSKQRTPGARHPTWVPSTSFRTWKDVEKEFGKWSELPVEERQRREIIIQRHMRAQPDITVNGMNYGVPHSPEVEHEAMSDDMLSDPEPYIGFREQI